MPLDLSTQLWMAGVIAFGVIFYFIALRYAQSTEKNEKNNTNNDGELGQ